MNQGATFRKQLDDDRKKLNRDIDRIIFPWYERLWMSIGKKLYSWGFIKPQKIKIYNRYQILKNENKKRNRKSS
jgi:hypothetical protein